MLGFDLVKLNPFKLFSSLCYCQ